MEIWKRLKEHRVRHIALGVLLVMAGLSLGVGAYGDWQESATALGPIKSIGNQVLAMETDGEVVLAVGWQGLQGYEASGRKLPAKAMDELEGGLVPRGSHSSLVLGEGLAISSTKVVDLRTGNAWPLDGSVQPHGVIDGRIYGTSGSQIVSIPLHGGVATEVAPAIQEKYRQLALDPTQAPAIRAISSQGALISYATNQTPRQDRTEFWPWTAEEPVAWPWSTWHVTSHGDRLNVLEQDSEYHLKEIIFRNGALEPTIDIAIQLPEDASINGLEVNDSRWVVTYTGFRFDSGLGPTQTTGFLFGTWAGNVEGQRESASFFGLGTATAVPGDATIIFLEDSKIRVGHPGAISIIWPTLASLAVLLTVSGTVWPTLAKRHLHRTANGGATRCLNCGKRRQPGIQFCFNCAWRTAKEEETAAARKKSWEYWDYDR